MATGTKDFDRRIRIMAALNRARSNPDVVKRVRKVQKKAAPRGTKLGQLRAKMNSTGLR